MLTGLEEKDSGTIAIRNGSKISYKLQEIDFNGTFFEFCLVNTLIYYQWKRNG